MTVGRAFETDDSTSRTLLDQVRRQDPAAWRRFVHLYGPTIYQWCRRAGLQPHDAADVSQEVFQSVARHISRFRRDRAGDSFRGWLRTIAANGIRDHFRARRRRASEHAAIDDIPAPDPATLDPRPGANDDLARRALELIQTEFETRTWRAFLACAVEGRTAAEAAAEFGMTQAAVHKAKYRVLHRLRRELDGLLD